MKVSVSILSDILDGDDKQTAAQNANGFLRACDNSLELTYREAGGEEGLGNTLTSLRLFPTHMELSRQGDYRCLLTLEPGVTHDCDYATPFGALTLTTDTTAYHSSVTKDGYGDVTVHYALTAAGNRTEHTLKVTVKPL